MEPSERSKRVLAALVREYIASGEPVASSLLVRAAAAGIEGPLVHRDEMNLTIGFDESLRTISVMHVPVGDEHALGAVCSARVPRGKGHISEDAKTHRSRSQGVVARWPDRAKRASTL